MPTFWSNDRGELLVNDAGNPFYTDSCCCLSKTYCWKKWVTSYVYKSTITCADASVDGSWTRPVDTEAQCNSEKEKAPDGMDGGVWRQYAVGERYMWKLSGTYKDSGKCARNCKAGGGGEEPARPTAPPDCCYSCNGAVAVEPPHYNAAVLTVQIDAWNVSLDEHGEPVSTYIGRAWCPEWDVNSSRFQPVSGLDANYFELHGYRLRAAKIYISNYYKGLLGQAEGFCPEEGEQYIAWSERRHSAHFGTHRSYVVTGAAYPAANGVYVDMWGADVKVRNTIYPNGSGNEFWMSDGALYRLRMDGGTATSEAVPYVERSIDVYEYPKVFEPGWTWQWAADQWGYMNVVVAGEDWGSLGWGLVREAHGAYCAKQDVPIDEQTKLGGETAHASGSPLWYYRTYITTDLNLYASNNWNADYLCVAPNVDYSLDLTQVARMTCEVCPTYYYLSVVEHRPTCLEKNAGKFCDITEASSVIRSTKAPQAWPYASFVAQNASSTVWMHRRYTPQPDYEVFNPTMHGTALKMLKLGINNYPDWYMNDKCAGVCDPTNNYVPQYNFGDDAWSCENCNNPALLDCTWPDTYRTKPEHTRECSYPGKWSAVAAIDHIDNGGTEDDCSCVGSLIAKLGDYIVREEPDPMGGSPHIKWYANATELYGMKGCPDWNFMAYGYCIEYISSFCYWTSRHSDESLTSHRIVNGKPSSAIYITPITRLLGRNTWTGGVYDPVECTQGGASERYFLVHTGPSKTIDETNHTIRSVVSCGIELLQFPQFCCADDEHTARTVYTPITYDTVKDQLSSTARLIAGGYDRCAWSALQESDVIDWRKGATVYCTHIERGVRERNCIVSVIRELDTMEDHAYVNRYLASYEFSYVLSSELTESIELRGTNYVELSMRGEKHHSAVASAMTHARNTYNPRDPDAGRGKYYSTGVAVGSGSSVIDSTFEGPAIVRLHRSYNNTVNAWEFVVDAWCPDYVEPWVPGIPESIIHNSWCYEQCARYDDTRPWTQVDCGSGESVENWSGWQRQIPDSAEWDILSGEINGTAFDNSGVVCGAVLPVKSNVLPEGLDVCWTKHTNGQDHAECVASKRMNWSYDGADWPLPEVVWESHAYTVRDDVYAYDAFSIQYNKEY